MAKESYVLAFDLGTDALSGLVIDRETAKILDSASAGYGFVENLPAGHMEQRPEDWRAAVKAVMAKLHAKFNLKNGQVKAIGLAGQMHGEVNFDVDDNKPPETVRLWCDGRNAEEGFELSQLFNFKVPQRITISRWLWTIRQRIEQAQLTDWLTTPVGWLFHELTGQRSLGIGEASGMFPIDPQTGSYSQQMMRSFDALTQNALVKSIGALLPQVCKAGKFAGSLNEIGAELLGLPRGTPVAEPEGDQPAALTGSLVYEEGDGAFSVGTSFVVNAIRKLGQVFTGIHPAIDHFCDPIGQPFDMIWVKNGGSFLKMWLQFLQAARRDAELADTYKALLPVTADVASDCQGLSGFPFIIGEPGLGFDQGGVAAVFGMTPDNLKPANLLHLAFVLPMFGIKSGLNVLADQHMSPKRLIVTGGIAYRPEYAGPVISAITNLPVFIPSEATEGTAYGAGLLAILALRRRQNPDLTYQQFLAELAKDRQGATYQPDPGQVAAYNRTYLRWREMFPLQEALHNTLGG